MQVANPIWLLLGALFCLAFHFLLQHLEKQKEKKLKEFAAGSLLGDLTKNVSQRKRKIKRFLLLAAIFCCFAAMARPQYGHRWIDVKRKGIDILFALDTSASMMAEDTQPNRLQRAKYAIIDFVRELEGDRVGLLPFAGSSYLMCPLTVDYSAFEQSLQAVTTEIIPVPGTNIAQAITEANRVLQNDANHKLLIIITDGENLDGDIKQAAQSAVDDNMTIFTVGVGTAKGELIPVSGKEGSGFVKDDSGSFVTSKLDEENLKLIAESTGGIYAPLGNRGQGLELIYQEKLSLIPKEELAERRQKVPIERFPWPLALALLLLACEFLLNSRKREVTPFSLMAKFPKLNKTKLRSTLLLLLGTSLLLTPELSNGSQGEEAYQREDYLAASQYYQEALEKDPENTTLHYNLGTTAYKNNLHDEAIASFSRALLSDDLSLQQRAYYNLGNAQFRKGEEMFQASPEKAIHSWEEALKAYQACLQLAPENLEAIKNHDYVKQKLEELKQQQERQDNNSQNQEDQNQEKGDKQDKPSEDSEDKPSDGNQDQAGQQDEKRPEKQEGEQQNSKDDREKDGGSQKQEREPKQNDDESPSPAEQKEDDSPSKNGSAEEPSGISDEQLSETGELTRQEAELLLDEMKNEEGALNFIPKKQSTDTPSRRNW